MSKRKNIQIIDQYCDHRDGTIHKDYDVTLNMTDIKTNKNKYYIMQIIQKGNQHILFIRYGRIGERGRISHGNFDSAIGAESKFEKQFYSKTKNRWSARKSFTAIKGKYHLLQVDYSDVLKDDDNAENEPSTKKPKKVESQLDIRVQQFLELVSDMKAMNNAMIDLDIDTKKLPLGKLSQNQIDRGYTILNSIKTLLKSTKGAKAHNNDQIIDLSSDFYTIIPYACGRNKPPVIDDDARVEKFTKVLDELSNIEVAAKIVKNSQDSHSGKHPLDIVYENLNTQIKPVEKNSKMWNIIKDYVHNTHASTHNSYSIELADIYEIQRDGERDIYDKHYGSLDNKMLLWHGTRLTNYMSILQKGLLLRPDVIPGTYVTGKMFGYGIYAANSFSKSFNYTGTNKRSPTACLFLAEVGLGKTSNRTSHDYYISKESLKKVGCHSTWGRGKTSPSSHVVLDDGVIVPNGKLQRNTDLNSSLMYDEFIVYDQNQLNLKYIVQVKGYF